jgi:putative oxidoreductase
MLARLQLFAYTALRIVAGFLFTIHGLQKLLGWFGGRVVDLTSLLGAAAVIETIGGVLITVGFWTQPIAFVASGEMAIAYFRAHYPQAPWPILNDGEPAVLFCFIFLYVAFTGAGPLSLDALRGKGRRPRRS